MRAALLALTALGCHAPDRWHTSLARGQGDIDGMGWHDFDQETTTLEVGVSGPLFASPKAEPCPPPPMPRPIPLQLDGAPSGGDGGIPWIELILLLSGAVAGKGAEVGVKKIRRKA